MNIIKLKDVLMPKEFAMADLFNTKLKGKYAYCIQMRYIFPLDSLCYANYVRYEQLDAIDFLDSDILPHIDLYSEEFCMIDFVHEFVDTCATNEANDIYKYVYANEFVTDVDIDMSMIRMFRSWLAKEILRFNTDLQGKYIGLYDPKVVHMLEYYSNNMYNEVVKSLTDFGSSSNIVSNASKNACGCCNSNISSLYNSDTIAVCDALEIYRNNIHALMVSTFQDINFWKQFNVEFIKMFKKYIDNIITVGLTVNKPVSANAFIECSCSSNSATDNNNTILNRLSKSLGYIIDEETTGHLNYIHDALYDWAEYLYEYMYWPIN